MFSYYLSKVAILAAVAATSADAFVSAPTLLSHRCGHTLLHSEKSVTGVSATINIEDSITINDKIELSDPTAEERGKGGVKVRDNGGNAIKALEVIARIPRNLILASTDMSPRIIDAVTEARNITWATELTAVTLAALHPTEDEIASSGNSAALTDDVQIKKTWIQSWKTGGWGSATDLGPDIARDVVGTLLTTGSDNDHNVYAKFRMPCHPAILKASMGLNFLTKCTEDEARNALTARGFTYRSMRDALQVLVLALESTANKGTLRDKRCWAVGDALDRVLARATTLQLDGEETPMAHVIVPIHERLAHSLNANSKLVSIDEEVLLVATRDIVAGESITRDYSLAPRIVGNNGESSVDSKGPTALQLLLQFGLPPSAWP